LAPALPAEPRLAAVALFFTHITIGFWDIASI
jgi:hypothetical protein